MAYARAGVFLASALWHGLCPAGALKQFPLIPTAKPPLPHTPVRVREARKDAVRYTKCRYGRGESCAFKALKANALAMIYPGGKTRCMLSTDKEFGFGVVPRDPEKLLFYFEGGGACWNDLSFRAKACTTHGSYAPPLLGILNGSAPTNPLRNHTLVYLNHCSGDLHSGNVKQLFLDARGLPVEQRGFHNTWSAIDWVKSNLAKKPLKSLVISGESAGSIAVQVWARTLLSELKYEQASVVADSYMGAFPAGFQGSVYQILKVCDSSLLKFNVALRNKCVSGQISIPDLFEDAIAAHPSVDFGMLTSKYDARQMSYYKLAVTSMTLNLQPVLLPSTFGSMGEEIISRYTKYSNFGHFLATSTWHVYTAMMYNDYGEESALCFNADTRKRLEAWFDSYALHSHQNSRVCEVADDATTKALELWGVVHDSCNLGKPQWFSVPF